MTVWYLNPCYNKVCYKETALNVSIKMRNQIKLLVLKFKCQQSVKCVFVTFVFLINHTQEKIIKWKYVYVLLDKKYF